MTNNKEDYKKRSSDKLQLDLDSLAESPSPSSKYDIGGLRHYIIIEKKNKEAFLDEVCEEFRELIESLLEEYDEERWE